MFGGMTHISLRSLPGMRERSIRLGSAGKTFSYTAWKVCGGGPRTSTSWSASPTCMHSHIRYTAKYWCNQTCIRSRHLRVAKPRPGLTSHELLHTCIPNVQSTRGCMWLQVGWMTGPARLLNPIIKAHQFLVFTVASNLQRAVAHGLDNESSFYL